ncbi:DUF262 domain-containing protein [Limimaricola litoreus]|uniref:DUF262 domain-containing protein n=1 Tax=Limimaricola litoreus TaxID=2955316 RepID=A0A9X2FPJ2_9RHOB|nr:DUF262 domain-containing protein [Limimaricola litoreus]MCP1169016.1 DUF262 domain-containing protein [Limimaricola litoreus]
MEARNRTIEDWFAWIRDGHIVLPRFQRFEAWGWWQVEGILENILRKPALPVGALLTLEVGEEAPFHARPISGAPEPEGRPGYHLLDGQQRLTALWRSLNGFYHDFTYMVGADGGEEPEVDAVRRYDSRGRRYPVWCDDPSETWRRGKIPAQLLAPDEAGRERLKAWAREAANGDWDVAAEINEVANQYRNRVAKFSIPFLSLPLGTDRDAALDVFIKMNTQNTALSAFDIVVAQVEADMDASLHEKVEGLRAAIPEIAGFGDPGEIAMQVGAVIMGQPPNRATYLGKDFGANLASNWESIETGISRAVRFLAEEKVYDARTLPADPLLTLLAGYWASAPNGGDAEGAARRLARRAFWTGAFSERYQKTSATRSALDCRQLMAYRDDGGHLPELLNQKLTPLPSAEELRTGGWPKTKDRLGRAIMAASLRAGGYDFADEAPYAPGNIARREYHHLFPKALLESDFPRREVFCALNCALVSWRTNRSISAKPPSVYIRERADEVGIAKSEVDRRLRSHGIPMEALIADDFRSFIAVRSVVIHGLMVKLCDGEGVGLEDILRFEHRAGEVN